MDYIISEAEMAKYQAKLRDLTKSHTQLEIELFATNQKLKQCRESLSKTERTLEVERITTSAILQKVDELNKRLIQCNSNPSPTRISFDELA